MNGEISTGALRCSTRRKTRAQKTFLSRLLSSLIFILSAAPLVASAQNRALDFDGINDRLELTSAKTTLNYGGNDFTIEMLVKTSRTGVDAKQSAGGNAGDGHRGSPIFCTRTSNRPQITEPQKERKKNEPEGSFFSKLS
jgi:hypothetical protein